MQNRRSALFAINIKRGGPPPFQTKSKPLAYGVRRGCFLSVVPGGAPLPAGSLDFLLRGFPMRLRSFPHSLRRATFPPLSYHGTLECPPFKLLSSSSKFSAYRLYLPICYSQIFAFFLPSVSPWVCSPCEILTFFGRSYLLHPYYNTHFLFVNRFFKNFSAFFKNFFMREKSKSRLFDKQRRNLFGIAVLLAVIL